METMDLVDFADVEYRDDDEGWEAAFACFRRDHDLDRAYAVRAMNRFPDLLREAAACRRPVAHLVDDLVELMRKGR